MSNQLIHLLAQWYPRKDSHQWVLGLIYKTEGSCYRKAGAVMLFSDAGHQLGVLSGGCLESDINKQAQRVIQDGKYRTAVYDDNDEEDIAFKLGVGCGGVVHLALLPVNSDNHYLQLHTVYSHLVSGNACLWKQEINGELSSSVSICGAQPTGSSELADTTPLVKAAAKKVAASLDTQNGKRFLTVHCQPPPHILIIGGGYDATFVVKMAVQQGWSVSVWDPRPAQARVEHFADANFIVESTEADALNLHIAEHNVDAAVLMSHHRQIDSKALATLSRHPLKYVAMLGPIHRKEEMFALAGVTESDFQGFFASPAGFDIGGDLPESIALSIIAQCHAVLAQKLPSLQQ
ncbi:XdhC family protein [Alteromonas stellipolaris]|uniref:XdhC family protein n=1 Tax=Alteromonas stellipolaris TaxID=233316 RepID=UPI0026E30EF4|nr:XdhC/CoxI family protein [Alteromonas stellipolaris]MDO6536878.1 XdhC/CoxI family protein [Alteromonas stellipolaris]MDO6628186.1 XdhC/CoxI family protein [Alteromonas stellipolaris]MDP2598126.1 XdhC/CoxI family protein [Alteromonas stellipolaris]